MVRAFLLGLRELLTLAHAEERAREIDEPERARRKSFYNAAITRRAAARRLARPVAAIILLREALHYALRARDGRADVDLIHAVREFPCKHSLAQGRVLQSLVNDAPLALDTLTFSDADSLRDAHEICIAAALREANVRSVFAILALRIARPLAVIIVIGWALSSFIRSHFLIHNLALGKPVTSSQLRGESPTAEHVVDGIRRGTFGLATVDVEHPFVLVDLLQASAIDHVTIVNRGDGWFDDSLPLVLSLSDDAVHFTEVGRRDDHFEEWTVSLGARPARFVRVTMPSRGYIALNEIEIYGRTLR